MERDSFIFYRSYLKAIEKLSKKQQLMMFKAIAYKSLDNTDVELTGPAEGMFSLIVPQIEANRKKYENGTKGAEYGKMGGRPINPKETPDKPQVIPNDNPKGTPSKPQDNPDDNPMETPNVNVNDNVNVNVIDAPLPPKGGTTSSDPYVERAEPVPFAKIRELFNEICASFPKIQIIDGQRKKAVSARFKTYGDITSFQALFEKAESSSFLKGNNDRNWRADFDWLMKPTNMAKVLEGKYDGSPHTPPTPPNHTGGKPDTLGVLASIIAEEEGEAI